MNFVVILILALLIGLFLVGPGRRLLGGRWDIATPRQHSKSHRRASKRNAVRGAFSRGESGEFAGARK